MLARAVALSLLGFCSACGGAADVEPGAGTGGAGNTPATRRPPTNPNGPSATGTTPTVLAINQLFIGDTDRAGLPSGDAWKAFGYDLDGLYSVPSDTNHCAPAAGSAAERIQTDGDGGVDNSFGRNILPALLGFSPDASQRVNESITYGEFSILFKFENLGPEATQSGVVTALHSGLELPVDQRPPKFDGTDEWPLSPELVNNGDVNDPKVVFNSSYVVDGTWVSGTTADLSVKLIISGVELNLQIKNAVITMDISGVGTDAVATNGVIAGVIENEAMVQEMKNLVGAVAAELCGPFFENIAQTVRAASDIMSDASNGDPTTTCNAISIGLGFTARPAALGPIGLLPPKEDPCAPAP